MASGASSRSCFAGQAMVRKPDYHGVSKMSGVTQAVRGFILANYLFTDDAAALSDGVSLMESGIVDSTGILELIGFLEEKFGIRVADEEMIPDNLDSVEKITAFVARKGQGG